MLFLKPQHRNDLASTSACHVRHAIRLACILSCAALIGPTSADAEFVMKWRSPEGRGTYADQRVFAPADLNGDGVPDQVVSGRAPNGETTIYAYSGLSQQELWAVTDTLYSAYPIVVEDLDGDGRLELAYSAERTNPFRGEVRVLDPTTRRLKYRLWNADATILLYNVRDGDGDGLLDLVVISYPGGSVSQIRTELHGWSAVVPLPEEWKQISHAEAESAIQVSPSPSEGNVRFEWRDASGPLDVRIHDVSGRLVRVLRSPAANVSGALEWDSRDDDGALVPSGPYFYTVRVEGRPDAQGQCVILR